MHFLSIFPNQWVETKDQNIGNYGYMVLGFYRYIKNIIRYFDKNIDKAKFNKNNLKFILIFY